MRTGRLLGSGRSADVYEIDEAWVLRRDRGGWGDATAEAVVMRHVHEHGYPVPGVRAATRADLVMERRASSWSGCCAGCTPCPRGCPPIPRSASCTWICTPTT